MNINFNKENFMNCLKTGLTLTLCTTQILALTACNTQEIVLPVDTETSITSITTTSLPNTTQSTTTTEKTTTQTTNTTTISKTNDSSNTDVNITSANNEEVKDYDWIEIQKKLQEDPEFVKLILGDNNKSKYGLVLYENEESVFDDYFRVIDSNGNFVTEKRNYNYLSVKNINKILTLIEVDPNYDNNTEKKYLIFNHDTNEGKEISAVIIYKYGDYLERIYYDGDSCYSQLLHLNGDVASSKKYFDIVGDLKNDRIYLVDEDYKKTTLLKDKDGKSKQIDYVVQDAYNNYIIVSDKNNNVGVYYLDDVDNELKEVIPISYTDIYFANQDSEKIRFICRECTNEDLYYLCSETGEKLTKGYSFMIKQGEENSILAYSLYDYYNNESIISYLNHDGVEIVSNIEAQNVYKISGTEALIFQENGKDGKYGVMDYNKNIILNPEFDRLYQKTVDSGNDFIIIGTKIDGEFEEIYIFDSNFNQTSQLTNQILKPIQKKLGKNSK